MTLRTSTLGSARVITLARAERKNALSAAVAQELAQSIGAAGEDGLVRGVIVAAEGDVFMAGGDLDEFAAMLDHDGAAERVIAMGSRMQAIEHCPVPVVAAVAGHVYGGGCEFALLCDAVFAEEGVSFSFRHARMGLAPAWGGLSRLLERVGPLHASRLLLGAAPLEASEAASIGLVTASVPVGDALTRAAAWIEQVAHNDRDSVAANKLALGAARAQLREGVAAIEADTFKRLWAGPAHRRAMAGRRGRSSS